MSYYHQGMACDNGLGVNDRADSSPEFNAKFCKKCGAPTLTNCPSCEAPIRGHYATPGLVVISARLWKPDGYCHECGAPYPWTAKAAETLQNVFDELEGLSEEEHEHLKKSIPDILRETQGTDLAALRLKKVAAKVGEAGWNAVVSVLSAVATAAVMKKLGLGD